MAPFHQSYGDPLKQGASRPGFATGSSEFSGIYYIGGASAAGKSTIAARQAARYGLPHIQLDDVRDAVGDHISDMNLYSTVIEAQAVLVADLLLRLGSSCILEGGWIKPDKAQGLVSRYGSRFCPVYCGYFETEVGIPERYALMRRRSRHWLVSGGTRFGRTEAFEFMRSEVDASARYREQCLDYGFPFFDFSDFEVGSSLLEGHFLSATQSLGGAAEAARRPTTVFRHRPKMIAKRLIGRKTALLAAGAAALVLSTATALPTSHYAKQLAIGQWFRHAVEELNHLMHQGSASASRGSQRSDHI